MAPAPNPLRRRSAAEPATAGELGLLTPAVDAELHHGDLAGLATPVRRHLMAAIAFGTPLATSARLRMRGRLKLGSRWLPFHARQVLSPQHGFVWSARVAGVITGSDRYVDGAGALDWRLLGLRTVLHAEGPDVDRSAAGRAAVEAVWLPTTLLPRFGVRWSALDDHHLLARYALGDVAIDLHLHVDDVGRLTSVVFDRWGDPDGTGTWGLHPFGMDVTAHETVGGLTIPAAGVAGWFHGTEREDEGRFFRFRITALEPVQATS